MVRLQVDHSNTSKYPRARSEGIDYDIYNHITQRTKESIDTCSQLSIPKLNAHNEGMH